MYKRDDHVAAVWLFLQTPLFCSSVAPLFGTAEKKGVTLQRKLGVYKNEQTVAARRSLFYMVEKGTTTHARFTHFCKPLIFAAAWLLFPIV